MRVGGQGATRHHRRFGLVGSLALAAALLALPSPLASAELGPDSAPCRPSTCKSQVLVGDREVFWRSTERFYPNNERVLARLVAAGKRLRMVGVPAPGACRHRFRGGGVSATVKACGGATPLQVQAVRVKRGAKRLKVVYRGDLAMGESRSGQPDPLLESFDLISGP